MDDLNLGNEPPQPRFFFLWLYVLRIRVGIALIAGAVPAIVLYDVTGWGVLSSIVGVILSITAMVFVAIYAPRY